MPALTPITIPDDGLRLLAKGTTIAGSHAFNVLYNPEHILHVQQERARRAMIQETNIRHFS